MENSLTLFVEEINNVVEDAAEEATLKVKDSIDSSTVPAHAAVPRMEAAATVVPATNLVPKTALPLDKPATSVVRPITSLVSVPAAPRPLRTSSSTFLPAVELHHPGVAKAMAAATKTSTMITKDVELVPDHSTMCNKLNTQKMTGLRIHPCTMTIFQIVAPMLMTLSFSHIVFLSTQLPRYRTLCMSSGMLIMLLILLTVISLMMMMMMPVVPRSPR